MTLAVFVWTAGDALAAIVGVSLLVSLVLAALLDWRDRRRSRKR